MIRPRYVALFVMAAFTTMYASLVAVGGPADHVSEEDAELGHMLLVVAGAIIVVAVGLTVYLAKTDPWDG